MFYDGGPGLLIHPLWQIANAYFTGLKLEQEPLPDYVRYSFEFRERYDGYREELSAAEKAQCSFCGVNRLRYLHIRTGRVKSR